MFRIDRRNLLAGAASIPLTAITPIAFAKTGFSPDLRLRPTVHTGAERWSLRDRMSHYAVPGVAIAVVRAGRVEALQGFGTRISGMNAEIDADTLFSVGSVSKLTSAALCLRLAASGILDLDGDVNGYLKRWRVPAGSRGDDRAVTLRMLLSHTGGFNVHGFADYAPGVPLPTLVQTLKGEPPAMNKALARIDPAGSRSRYSGGGYMVIQAVIEDATGERFDAVAKRLLFGPLGMQRSRFEAAPVQDIGNIAHAHNRDGEPAALPRGWQSFPELAASGLWTTAGDLARMIVALGASYRGRGRFIPQELAVDMMTAVTPGFNGLGPRLAGEGMARIFHHAGANDSYKAYVEGNLASGDGLVVLTNGERGDVLGDEIRNAVSDAYHWPGDWSVALPAVTPVASLLDSYVGTYHRRPDQDPLITGFLDTGFSADTIEIVSANDGLSIKSKGRDRKLVPIDSSDFVMPDGYIPAATLMFRFARAADQKVSHLRAIAGADVLVFDKA
ncbi:serine hydrolase domain-containing protein [Sphingomonas sp. Leaf21]|uniref:serine hydrolase domain-containing protein n=1 Tax=Sphingomonas sp. Leaf21 TaxID=2876550 RepID=UPI001E3BC7F2|nr:serine hydrolase domain-containing protein [Sphingomonas sp. Leaf21]